MAHWTVAEVELVVADYFGMLAKELAKEPVNKKARYRRLAEKLIQRSEKSIEWKCENISAVLRDHSLPFVDGLKPASNYQNLLEQKTLEWIAGHPDFFEEAAVSSVLNPVRSPATDFSNARELMESPPKPDSGAGRTPAHPAALRLRQTDFVKRDADNRTLGRLGEEWAVEFERYRLHDGEERPDLAKNVVWVSNDEGDGAGYDIRSFNRDGSRRLIEVKTTGLGKHFPFYISANELKVSQQQANAYYLYRIFRFATAPRLYALNGPLDRVCSLTPEVFRARPSGR